MTWLIFLGLFVAFFLWCLGGLMWLSRLTDREAVRTGYNWQPRWWQLLCAGPGAWLLAWFGRERL